MCFFPATAVPEEFILHVRAALRGSERRAVAEAIAAGGETTIRGIAAATGISDRSAYYHTRQLIAAGLAERRGYTIAAKPDLLIALREQPA